MFFDENEGAFANVYIQNESGAREDSIDVYDNAEIRPFLNEERFLSGEDGIELETIDRDNRRTISQILRDIQSGQYLDIFEEQFIDYKTFLNVL